MRNRYLHKTAELSEGITQPFGTTPDTSGMTAKAFGMASEASESITKPFGITPEPSGDTPKGYVIPPESSGTFINNYTTIY